jgi:hypothetical protein
MKNLFPILIMLIFLTGNYSFGQFSRPQAINLVMDNALANDTTVDTYCAYSSYSSDIETVDGDVIENPYPVSWIFFVDDHPFADWYHSSRFIFVDKTSGNYATINSGIYPERWRDDYEQILMAVRPIPVVPENMTVKEGTESSKDLSGTIQV